MLDFMEYCEMSQRRPAYKDLQSRHNMYSSEVALATSLRSQIELRQLTASHGTKLPLLEIPDWFNLVVVVRGERVGVRVSASDLLACVTAETSDPLFRATAAGPSSRCR